MSRREARSRVLLFLSALLLFGCSARSPQRASLGSARQVIAKYCGSCHAPSGEASEFNWTDERALVAHRRNIAAKVRLNSMPPPGLPRPDADERRLLLCWAAANEDGCTLAR